MRDTDGQIRFIDNHHNFFAMSEFMGAKQKAFLINVKLFADYSTLNPKTGKKWTQEEMMEDLIVKNYVLIYGKDSPNFIDLKSLPKDIHQLSDLPERSIVSLVFREFSEPLKGSDFKPMIQLLLAEKMGDINISLISEKPYSDKNINRVRDEILNSRALLEFLLQQINPQAKEKRIEKVTDFLNDQLTQLNLAS